MLEQILAKLDLAPRWKTPLGFAGLILTAAIQMAAHLALSTTAPENESLRGTIDAIAEKAYWIFGSLLGYGISMKAIRADAATRTLPILLAIAGVWSLGCGELTVAECQSRAEQARAGALGCVYFPEEPDRAKCVAAADAAVAISRLGCEWAERPDPVVDDQAPGDPA